MPVTTYTTIDGEIVSQDVNGTVHDLLPDPLGHTVALLGSGQGIEFEYNYWPYEEIGSIDDVATALRYVGTLGYYSDDYGSPRVYVRARHYRGPYGRWLTVDPLWPGEEPYAYAQGGPVTYLDPYGYKPIRRGSNCDPNAEDRCIAMCEGWPYYVCYKYAQVIDCIWSVRTIWRVNCQCFGPPRPTPIPGRPPRPGPPRPLPKPRVGPLPKPGVKPKCETLCKTICTAALNIEPFSDWFGGIPDELCERACTTSLRFLGICV